MFISIYKWYPAMTKIGIFDFLMGTTWKPNNTPPSFGIYP